MAERTDAYRCYDPMLAEHASLAPDHPRRAVLRDQLLRAFHPVARNIATRFASRGEPREDLEQVAALGLLNALDRFDPARGTDFLSYAVPTMMGEVRRYFRDVAWTVRTPRGTKDRARQVNGAIATLSQDLGRAPTLDELARHLGTTHDEIVDAMNAGDAYRPASLDRALAAPGDTALVDRLGATDPALERVDTRALVGELLAALPVRERRMLALRFVDELTQYEIATELGISQMHVSRLLGKTLELLRERLREWAAADDDPTLLVA